MRDIILLMITVFCAGRALFKPEFGILAYIGYSLLAPHSLMFGVAKTFPHVLLIAVCTIIGFVISRQPKQLPGQREFKLLIALWLFFVVSTLFAFQSERAWDVMLYISKIFLMVVMTILIINDKEKLRHICFAIALALGFYGFKLGLFVLMTGAHSAVEGPDQSFLSANNTIGMAMAMNVPLLFYLSSMEQRVWLRYLMRAMMVLSYPATIGTFSRGAWVALAAGTALIVIKTKHKVPIVAAAGLFLLLSPLWLPMVTTKEVSDRFDTISNYEQDGSAVSRFWNWEFCTRVGFSNPVQGAGFDYYSREAYEKWFPEFLEQYPDKVWSCHNMWLTILGEHGIVGFAIWLSLLISCMVSLHRIRLLVRQHAELKWASVYPVMLQTSLVAFMVSGTFLDIAYFEVYYTFVAVIVILKEIIANDLRKPRHEKTAEEVGSVALATLGKWNPPLTANRYDCFNSLGTKTHLIKSCFSRAGASWRP